MTQGVARMDDWTAGDYAGAFAGAVAALAAIGKGLAWLLNWQGARSDRRAERLRLWEESLNRREQDFRQDLEVRLAEEKQARLALEARVGSLGVALFDVTLALQEADPRSAALVRVTAALRAAFPAEAVLPEGIAALLTRLDHKDRSS